ncbi:putative phage protein (predicted DNA packaging) [Sporomusaceae bacterium BoRhaA]|uniref:head-tail connector protein n=1 Tax=Pelorhabdus rhamnosifermentans TaxID=2772457 RepID=UPI001C0625D6|nr:head-tail connector protein [Pelorhabdus rhamnosifermentans]MBU2703881.1 putative phage protein (predicted DNA packaging) [Pelorhabdus rhamnosifermentans]
MTLDEVKSYLRVDGTDEDADITALMSAAALYITQQTGKTQRVTGYNSDGTAANVDITTDELYNTCNKLLIAHWYENRGVEVAGNLTRITHSVDAIINHIALCGDYV